MYKRIHIGFTLIELMIVIAIVAILASIALPAYNESIRKGRRAEARNGLLQTAQYMERLYTEQMTYVNGAIPSGVSSNSYDFQVLEAKPSDYTLTAAPKPGSAQEGDACGTFILDRAGAKTVSGGTLPQNACW